MAALECLIVGRDYAQVTERGRRRSEIKRILQKTDVITCVWTGTLCWCRTPRCLCMDDPVRYILPSGGFNQIFGLIMLSREGKRFIRCSTIHFSVPLIDRWDALFFLHFEMYLHLPMVIKFRRDVWGLNRLSAIWFLIFFLTITT